MLNRRAGKSLVSTRLDAPNQESRKKDVYADK